MTPADAPQYFLARWILPVHRPPMAHAFLTVEGGRITALGDIQDLPEDLRHAYDFNSDTTLITPGLINTHTHLELSFGRPIPLQPGETMTDWLLGVIRQVQSAATAEAKEARCQAGLSEMLRTGTTCINDICSDGTSLHVLHQAGMRGIVSLEFFHPDWEEILMDTLVKRFKTLQSFQTDLIRLGLSPHSPYNVSPKAWQHAINTCQPSILHTHLSESRDEMLWLAQTSLPSPLDRLHQTVLGKTFTPQIPGKTPTAYLHHFGLLDYPLIAAHGVYTTGDDRTLLAGQGIRLAHCPRSNQALQQETLAWQDWKDSGIPVGLGTDSHLSCPSLDIREEARHAMALHHWEAEEALRRITLEGARVLGLEQQIGSLTPGMTADIVSWQFSEKDIPSPAVTSFFAEDTKAYRVFIKGHPVYNRSRPHAPS